MQDEDIYPHFELHSTIIKLPETKDPVTAFTEERALVTNPLIKGKGRERVSSTDLASIGVWVEVDGVSRATTDSRKTPTSHNPTIKQPP